MSRSALLALGVWMILMATGSARCTAEPPALDPAKPLSEAELSQRLAAVQPGLAPDAVRRLIGPPRSTCRQILYHRSLEQWLYDFPFSVRLEFDCVRGQEPRLLSVQPLESSKP